VTHEAEGIMGRLDGKVAIVTGAAGGIGSCIVDTFLREGATVFAADSKAGRVRAGAPLDDRARPLRLDVTVEAQWEAAIDEVRRQSGGLDILVNAAAHLQPGDSFATTTSETWSMTFRVNTEGVFLGCKQAIPAMTGRGDASIINISSGVAVRASAQAPAYCSSKAAVIALTKSIALYCAQKGCGIRANVILPGAVDTPMLRRNIAHSGLSEAKYLEKVRNTHPLGRIGQPPDIASAAVFLASVESSFITGIELPVDGGQIL